MVAKISPNVKQYGPDTLAHKDLSYSGHVKHKQNINEHKISFNNLNTSPSPISLKHIATEHRARNMEPDTNKTSHA